MKVRPGPNSAPDPTALQLTREAYELIQPDAAILFGSRARGDYEEHRSDVDIMIIGSDEPSQPRKDALKKWADSKSLAAFGRPVPVQLVWLDREEFARQEQFVNSLVTRAIRHGTIMANNPEEFSSRYDDEETELQYIWTDYDNRLYHAEEHLQAFHDMVALGRSDLLTGQQAHLTLEYGIKAVISGHGEHYPETHNIGNLVGRMRQLDPRMSNFALEIHADVYTEYAGRDEYREGRRRPTLTEHPNWFEATVNAAEAIIGRARQLGPNSMPRQS